MTINNNSLAFVFGMLSVMLHLFWSCRSCRFCAVIGAMSANLSFYANPWISCYTIATNHHRILLRISNPKFSPQTPYNTGTTNNHRILPRASNLPIPNILDPFHMFSPSLLPNPRLRAPSLSLPIPTFLKQPST
ncbi:hypothetical protein VNO80_26065 [Phaseolus coccineus]|uniref:Uncharacterized protein n=1 Tax=Phaseolus coccineus TaxID=3886 RepID=A0AAN9M0I0_PHACN